MYMYTVVQTAHARLLLITQSPNSISITNFACRKYWAQQLFDMLRDSKWQYQVLQPIIQGDVTCDQCNRDMNFLFVKLHLLDPTLIMSAYQLLQKGISFY